MQDKLRIYLRNENTSLEITCDEGVITLESRAMLNSTPHDIERWGCKYRRMSDGRCFVVMRTFVPTSFLCDLLWDNTNKEAQNELASFLANEYLRIYQEREAYE